MVKIWGLELLLRQVQLSRFFWGLISSCGNCFWNHACESPAVTSSYLICNISLQCLRIFFCYFHDDTLWSQIKEGTIDKLDVSFMDLSEERAEASCTRILHPEFYLLPFLWAWTKKFAEIQLIWTQSQRREHHWPVNMESLAKYAPPAPPSSDVPAANN